MILKKHLYSTYLNARVVNPNPTLANYNYQKDVENRLGIEISKTYAAGGICITLVLSYNDENLPFFQNPETLDIYRVYNHDHIRTFLNRLKVYSRRQNLCSYKYFICSEYGGQKGRPHYHILFFLQNSSIQNIKGYVDLTRSIWSYGFVFPSPTDNPYIKCQLRYKNAAASYVAKYVTKDLDYKDDPCVAAIKLEMEGLPIEDAKIYRDMLPRLYQSNGIGMVENLDESLFLDYFENGYLHPLTLRKIPLPRYIVNKFLYKLIPALDDRLNMYGQKMYDREVKVSFETMYKYKLLSLLNKRNAYKDMLDICDDPNLFSCFETVRLYNIDLLTAVTCWQYSKYFSHNTSQLIETLQDMFDISKVANILTWQTDIHTRYKITDISGLSICDRFLDYKKLFLALDQILNYFMDLQERISIEKVAKYREDSRLYEKHRLKRIKKGIID